MKGSAKTWFGIACVFAAACSIVLIVVARRSDVQPHVVFSPVQPSDVSKDTLPSGMKQYVHPSVHFSFFIPEEMQVEVQSEAGGAETDLFSGGQEGKEFQLFILPYSKDMIEESRIQEDTHGTASGMPVEVILGGGIHGLAFTSSDPQIGDLREIWFLINGHLIEATTPIENDGWLADILGSLAQITP